MNNIQKNILTGTNNDDFQIDLDVMDSILAEMREEVREYEAIHGKYEAIEVKPHEIAQILNS